MVENLILIGIVVFDVALLLWLASWAARGGSGRTLIGLALSLLFGAIFGVPIFVLATLHFRRRRQAA